MGGIFGWDGYETATRLLCDGYRLRGEELLIEIERFKVLEMSELEIEAAKRKRDAAESELRSGHPGLEGVESVEGDLGDFEEEGS